MTGRFQLFEKSVAVDWAEPEPTVEEEILSKVLTLPFFKTIFRRSFFLKEQRKLCTKYRAITSYLNKCFLSRPFLILSF